MKKLILLLLIKYGVAQSDYTMLGDIQSYIKDKSDLYKLVKILSALLYKQNRHHLCEDFAKRHSAIRDTTLEYSLWRECELLIFI